MKLTGRKAAHDGEKVTFISEILHSNNMSMVAHIDDDLNLNEDVISMLTLLPEETELTKDNMVDHFHIGCDSDGEEYIFL